MTDAEIMAQHIATVRAYLAALEAMSTVEVRDPTAYLAEQAAFRGLNLIEARHYAQQRWMALPPPKEK